MGRYTGPKCRLCRREGMKLFLKGVRCESEKCAIARRDYAFQCALLVSGIAFYRLHHVGDQIVAPL